jgi:putative oxidoreductase
MMPKVLHLCARLGLAGLFLWTGISKFAEPAAFAQDISHYRLLPQASIGVLALGLPVLECVAGLALLTRTYFAGGAALISSMLLVFAAGMAQARLRGIDLDCGCFGGATAEPVTWSKVALNVGLAMLAGWVAWIAHGSSAALQRRADERAAQDA